MRPDARPVEAAGQPESPPPDHILAAFAVAGVHGVHLPDGRAWRFGDEVLKPIDGPVEASWVASVFDSLRVESLRIARPVRSTDGRWVVGGWCAQRFVSGRPAPRHADAVRATIALQQALAGVPEPRFLADRRGIGPWADRIAWQTDTAADDVLGSGHGAELFAEIAAGRAAVSAPCQIIDGDIFGRVLFAGSAPPAVVGLTPLWRPAAYGVALIVTDAIAWGGAGVELAAAHAGTDGFGQMLRRALLNRLALALTHPRTTPRSLVELLSAVDVLRPMLDGR